MREDRKMGEASVDLSPVKARSCVAFSSAEELARTMLDIPEGMKVAIVRGRDGEGKEFCSFSDPMIDILSFPKEQQIDLKRMMAGEAYTSRDIREGRKVLVPEYRDVVGFIRFPLELVRKTQERKLTPSNYSRIIKTLIPEIKNDPEKWMTPI